MLRRSLASTIRFWSLAKGFSTASIRQDMEKPAWLALAGSEENRERLIARLAGGPKATASTTTDSVRARTMAFPDIRSAREAGQKTVLDADAAASRTDAELAVAIARIAQQQPELRIALAASFPAFRSVVIAQLITEQAKGNARLAALSALPGVIPMTDWLVPATAAGDMYVLTRNQILLLLQIAACYGLPPDIQPRLRELLPVVGGAFGWRAVARELIGLVPGGVGLVVKATVAYAGTMVVGRAASFYYASGGHTLSPAQTRALYRQAISDAARRVRSLLPLGRKELKEQKDA